MAFNPLELTVVTFLNRFAQRAVAPTPCERSGHDADRGDHERCEDCHEACNVAAWSVIPSHLPLEPNERPSFDSTE